jgi:hypothetical protein
MAALRAAHAAGNTADAQRLAAIVQRLQTAAPPATSNTETSPSGAAQSSAPSFLHTLAGEGEVGASTLGNIPSNAVNAAADLYSRITGGGPRTTPLAPTFEPGQAGKDFLSDVGGIAHDVAGSGLGQSLAKIATTPNPFMDQHSPTADVIRDAGHQALGVGSDVMNLLPAAGVAKGAVDVGKAAASIPGALTDAAAEAGGRTATDAGALGFRAADSTIGKALAGDSTGPALTHHNSAVGNTVIGSEAGLPAGTVPSAKALKDARAAPNAVYDRVAAGVQPGPLDDAAQIAMRGAGAPAEGVVNTGGKDVQSNIEAIRDQLLSPTNPQGKPWSGQDWVSNMRNLRQEGFKQLGNDDLDTQAIGQAKVDMARAIEDHVGRSIDPNSGTDLQQFQDARKTLAKNFTAEAALRGDTFDLKALGRVTRADPELLDGPMKTAADFAEANPEVTGNPSLLNKPSIGKDLHDISLTKPASWLQALSGGTGRNILTGGESVLGNGADPGILPPRPNMAPLAPASQDTLGPGSDMFGSHMDLAQPPGSAGAAPGVAPMNPEQYQFTMHAPAPLDLQPPPGSLGTPPAPTPGLGGALVPSGPATGPGAPAIPLGGQVNGPGTLSQLLGLSDDVALAGAQHPAAPPAKSKVPVKQEPPPLADANAGAKASDWLKYLQQYTRARAEEGEAQGLA